MRRTLLVFVVLFVVKSEAQKSRKAYNIRTIAFYNLENMFDTIDDVNKNDEASPIMKMKMNRSKVYWERIDKMARVISQIGLDKSNTSPAIIGIAEVETKKILEDLIDSKHLKSKDYEIIHYESPDKRGIDVALLYQQRYFKPVHHESYDPNIFKENRKIHTRNQLLVSGYLDDEMIHIIVNHWPSRRGGEAASRTLRERAAYQNRKIIDKIMNTEANPKIIIMGDLNDDPINSSIKTVLQASGEIKDTETGGLFNPYESMLEKGYHTLGYRDNINLFDQIIISSALIRDKKKAIKDYRFWRANILNKKFLTFRNGRYKGYPFRSFSAGQYTGGYSDHYPVYIYVIREAD